MKHALVFVTQRRFFHYTSVWCSHWQNRGLAILEFFLPVGEAFHTEQHPQGGAFSSPKRERETSLYKVVLALSLLLGRNEKFRYWGECILFSQNVEWTLSFSALSSLCDCKLTAMLRRSEKRKVMAWKSKLSRVGWIMKRFSLKYWSTDQGEYMLAE